MEIPADAQTILVPVGFDCELEIHDLKTFQTAGHWVTGLVDEGGFRRPWRGSEVYILTIRRNGEIVARAQGDSAEDVQVRMIGLLQDMFWSLWDAQRLANESLAGYYALKEKIDWLDGQLVRLFGLHSAKTTCEIAAEIATRWHKRPWARLMRALKIS